jgi:hypothetical protein
MTMGWFGPSRDEVWRELSRQIGADFVSGGLWKGSKVQAQVGPWVLTLDTYKVSRGRTRITYTRMRAPYLNPGGFRFKIYRKGFFSELGKLFGMQDIEIGEPEFDEAFILKGNDEGTVRDLFASPEIRRLALAQPRMSLEVKDSEGWFGPRFPPDVNELYFQVVGELKEIEPLRNLFDLFAAVLDRLCRIGTSYKQEPGVSL